jgi:hypothetical protein
MKELEEIVVEIEEALAGHRRSTRKTQKKHSQDSNYLEIKCKYEI